MNFVVLFWTKIVIIMASKRFGPMKDFARAKKPRLDVSVTRASTRPSPPRSIMDFWDEDDDVILMATQRAEAEIEAEERKRRAGEEVEARNEITFSEFAPMVQGSTSTQQMFPPPLPPPPPAKKSTALDLEAIFADDDDFDFLAVTLMDSEPQKPVEVQPSTSSSTRISIQQKTTTSTTTINSTQSRQQEHQIKFLMDRIEALKRDKSKLEKDLGDSNERNEIRSGEVSRLDT